MADNKIVLDMKALTEIIKTFKEKPPMIKVGILTSKDNRNYTKAEKKAMRKTKVKPARKTNVEIGQAHEFGDPSHNIPVRSFLRMPLMKLLRKKLDEIGIMDEKYLKEVIKERSVTRWLKEIASICEACVLEAFATNGFGSWKKLKPATIKRKKLKTSILTETQQLRNSIGSEVVKK